MGVVYSVSLLEKSSKEPRRLGYSSIIKQGRPNYPLTEPCNQQSKPSPFNCYFPQDPERDFGRKMSGYQLVRSTCKDSIKAIEADIQHANMLAASIPRSKSGEWIQMKLVHNQWAPFILYLLQWLNCSCFCLRPTYLSLFHITINKMNEDGRPCSLPHGRRATIRNFYAVILPYLQRLHGETLELNNDPTEGISTDFVVKKRMDEKRKIFDNDVEREDECGICLEPCTKMVLPSCCHSMCTNCYRDWNLRSESCPFCRGSIKRVKSEDLWVLTCDGDVVDKKTASKDDLLRFYLYINSLPKDIPDALFMVYYDYLI